jgi:hypothetical protein
VSPVRRWSKRLWWGTSVRKPFPMDCVRRTGEANGTCPLWPFLPLPATGSVSGTPFDDPLVCLSGERSHGFKVGVVVEDAVSCLGDSGHQGIDERQGSMLALRGEPRQDLKRAAMIGLSDWDDCKGRETIGQGRDSPMGSWRRSRVRRRLESRGPLRRWRQVEQRPPLPRTCSCGLARSCRRRIGVSPLGRRPKRSSIRSSEAQVPRRPKPWRSIKLGSAPSCTPDCCPAGSWRCRDTGQRQTPRARSLRSLEWRLPRTRTAGRMQ